MGSEDAMSHLDHYQSLPNSNKLVGIRDLAHDYSDPDILTRTPQLRAEIELAKSCPEMTFVLDHISKPDIAQGITEPWKEMITVTPLVYPILVCRTTSRSIESESCRERASF
jgi:L-fuconolactonase